MGREMREQNRRQAKNRTGKGNKGNIKTEVTKEEKRDLDKEEGIGGKKIDETFHFQMQTE